MTDLELYRALLLPRRIEERMLLLLRQGTLSKWFSGIGQEAVAVGVATALEPDDAILPMHRNLGVFTARGLELVELFRQLLGRENALTHGRDRSFHFGSAPHHIVGMISHLAAMLPVACGLGLAYRLRGERRVVAAFTGDGAASQGDVHESLNLAAVWKLPVIFCLENNQFALSTPFEQQCSVADLAGRAAGYGIPGVVCDGNDVRAVRAAVQEAAARARDGEGPTLIELKTFRVRAHEEASGTAYVPPELIEEWKGKDPVDRLAERVPPEERERLSGELDGLVQRALEEALAAPRPASTPDRELADVYVTPGLLEPDQLSISTRELRYVDALREGMRQALASEPRCLIMGQDVGHYGGVFKATEGLLEDFGPERVRNTPLIESGAVGAALGLALEGFRPIVEIQFGDFISCAFNQIVNNLAKTRYRWGPGVGVVVRAPVGGGTGAGPFHSQNVEAYFANVAGLKIVAPSTPHDAKGLLLSAVADGNPVLFLEHKLLYRSLKGPVPEGIYAVPIGSARVVRPGSAATVVTYGIGVHWALEAAEELGAEVEIVDLRTLLPWDRETVLGSVRKTGRCLVLHEAPLTGGFGGELAASIGQHAFEWLDAPVTRLGSLDTPVPFARELEEIFSARRGLVDALRDLLAY
ncbi:dehydrogenase [bacterium CPR1]|nr:dehydrogenase [bacterium CPR1]